MPLSTKIKVEVPESGVIKRKIGKHEYVYKTTRCYRNAAGKPTCDRVAIGRYDEESGKLIPNDKYWEIYSEATPVFVAVGDEMHKYESVKEIGADFLVKKVLDNLGASEIIKSAFGDGKGENICLVSEYMATEGNVIEHIENWCEEKTLDRKRMTSASASALFSSITHEEKMSFFRKWTEQRSEAEHIAYDVTSFSTYAKNITDAEYGYNRDGENLPQINLGCYLEETSELPMFYTTYPGSIVDKSHLPYMMRYNEELGVKKGAFVMDRGFASSANLQFMKENQYSFLIGVEKRIISVKEAILSVKNNIRSIKNRISSGLYGVAVKGVFYGVNSNLHIYFDAALAEQQTDNLMRKVETEDFKLSQIQRLTQNEAVKLRKYFDITIGTDGTFTYSANTEKIDEIIETHGFFALLTSLDLTSDTALNIYRKKDVIEKNFDDIKNQVDMKRLRTHNQATTDGKIFCAFIALIALSFIMTSCRDLMKKNSLSKNSLFLELNKIRLITLENGNRLLNPLTKLQRQILLACGFSQTDLSNFISLYSVNRSGI